MQSIRYFMIAAEVLAGIAILSVFVIPASFRFEASLSPHVSSSMPFAWLISMLLLIGAGLLSGAALVKLYLS